MDDNTTANDPPPSGDHETPLPGLVLLWSAQRPTCRPFPLTPRALVLGRDSTCDIALPNDNAASRRHAECTFDHGRLVVRDLGSSNGTYVDGERVAGTASFDLPRVVRVGSAVLVALPDIAHFDAREDLRRGDAIAGPLLSRIWDATVAAARDQRPLWIHGETGTGKERVAALFHARGSRASGPHVVVNCALLERERADAQLFGSTRGAYTGADRDRVGLFEQADGGTLFLDEVAELPLEVQAKLLRVLEDGVIQPLGGKAKRVSVAVSCATHGDLRALAREGRFREDLMMRLLAREVHVPPLRERREEIPFLVELFLSRYRGAPPPSARFIEACLRHEWPGNVRELAIAVERAAADAVAKGEAAIEAYRLPAMRSPSLQSPASREPSEKGSIDEPRAAERRTPREMRDDVIFAAVDARGGDVAAAASELGIGRATVYRALQRRR